MKFDPDKRIIYLDDNEQIANISQSFNYGGSMVTDITIHSHGSPIPTDNLMYTLSRTGQPSPKPKPTETKPTKEQQYEIDTTSELL